MSLESPRTMLIIDDEEYMRFVLMRLAGMLGFYLHTSTTAAEALSWLELAPAALVVADVTLGGLSGARGATIPGTDGCTLGREIVRRWPGTRLLFISGYAQEDVMEICPTNIPLLQKPFGPRVFRDRVAEILASPPWDPNGGT